MKLYLSLLALAIRAIAEEYDGDGYPSYPPPPDVTTTDYMTTYTTVTTCPAVTTVTTGGSTYVETIFTTSTIVVTECPGGSCGGEVTVTEPDTTVGTTTQVEITYTTTCPVTETITIGGSTQTNVYTTTWVEVTYVDTTIFETETAPPVTETTGEVVYVTKTSLCPITETKTVEGETVIVTWTSTSTIITEVPIITTEYISYTVTEHVETSVYETVTCSEIIYTTVSDGSTVCITNTETLTTYATEEFTVTETIPITETTEIEVTVTSQIPGGETVTSQPTICITYSDTTVISQPGYPTTVDPHSSVGNSLTESSTSTGSVIVPTGLASRASPGTVLLFGAAGLAALL
ncbi:hypothetical protein F5Y10DRAFT_108679 [Nemania abortiva]|nr:hypothetical protein F5Y10DRAFT_108679 [Nemania abortiva]